MSSLTFSWIDPAQAGKDFVVYLAEDDDVLTPDFTFPVTGNENGVFRVTCSGLPAGVTYSYGIAPAGYLAKVRDVVKTPPASNSFTFGAGSCSRSDSAGAIYGRIAELDPDFFVQLGDLHYEDLLDEDEAPYIAAYSTALANQQELFSKVPVVYIWDDHDGAGGNDSHSGLPGWPECKAAYAQVVPHYPLADAPEVYHSFVRGRVRFIVTDMRSLRSDPDDTDDSSKKMLGDDQEAWFKDELLVAKAAGQAICWVSSVPWIGTTTANSDKWPGYTAERTRLANFIATNDLASRMFGISGDVHCLAIYDPEESTDGDYSTGGGANFPWFNCAPIDQWTRLWDTFTTPAYPGIEGTPYGPRRQQFGFFDVTDGGGGTIGVEFTGYSLGAENTLEDVMSLSFSLTVSGV